MLFQTEAVLMPSVGGLPALPHPAPFGEPGELLGQGHPHRGRRRPALTVGPVCGGGWRSFGVTSETNQNCRGI